MSQQTALPSRPRIRKAGPLPRRQLWQVPTFIVGLLSLVAVASTRPLWCHGDEQKLARYLTAAHQTLDQDPADADRVIGLAERALKLAGPTGSQAAEAHFLLGSGQMLRAEQSTGDEALESWQQARYHLEQAELIGLPARHQLRHRYRLGKTYYHSNLPAEKVIEYLLPAVGAENSFEAFGLLARAYLRLDPPDTRKALEAVKRQLALPTIDEASLAAPRLLCGQLHHQLEQPDEARKVLQRIGPGAPPAILFQARMQLARLYQEEGAWEDAAKVWEQVKNDPRASRSEASRINYDLGLCYRHLDRTAEAAAAWEHAMGQPGEEGQAAGLGVAELRLYDGAPARTIEAFEAALARVARPDDYTNTLVDLAEARRRVETGCRVLLEANQHAAALRLATLYEKIAAPGIASCWAARVAEAWAKQQRSTANQADAAARATIEEEARKLNCQAAQAYLVTADSAIDPEARVQALWQAALNYQLAQNHEQTVAALERFVQMPVVPARLSQAWFVIGETQRLLKNRVAAQQAFRKCIEFPGPQAYHARFQLAQAELEAHRYDEAEAMLTQNLEMMPPDSDAREKTLYALTNLHFLKKDHRMTMVRAQEALERYPRNEGALKARLQMAQSCRALADQASQRLVGDVATIAERDHYRKLRTDFLNRAAEAFQQVDEQLAGLSQLSPEEQALGRQAAFALAECRFDLGQYEEALRIYEVLGVRYHHQVEGLVALRAAWQCHGVLLKHDQARATLERIRVTLREMPASAFDDSSDLRSRRWWENWVLERIKLADTRPSL